MKKILNIKVIAVVLVVVSTLVMQRVYSKNIHSIDFLQKPVSYVVKPFERVISSVTIKIQDTKKYFKNIEELTKENKQLKKDIKDLESYISKIKWLDERNQELRRTLELKDSLQDYKFVGANIIAKDSGMWFETFTVDRGGADGIYKNSFVIFENGLVGRVYKVGKTTCDIISIIDRNSAVGARIEKTRDVVVIKGDMTLKKDGFCKLEYIPVQTNLSVGDVVETSGIGEFFPKGIEIGRVRAIVNPNDKQERYAIVEPSVDLKRIEEVLIAVKE